MLEVDSTAITGQLCSTACASKLSAHFWCSVAEMQVVQMVSLVMLQKEADSFLVRKNLLEREVLDVYGNVKRSAKSLQNCAISDSRLTYPLYSLSSFHHMNMTAN